MEYYERIKILRQKNNMSQEDLSKLLNISQQSLSKYENNERRLPIDCAMFPIQKYSMYQ